MCIPMKISAFAWFREPKMLVRTSSIRSRGKQSSAADGIRDLKTKKPMRAEGSDKAWEIVKAIAIATCALAILAFATTLAQAQTITVFSQGISTNSLPDGIAAGPDGNLWFTEFNSSKIGRITPQGVVTEFSLAANSGPKGIAAGPDGNLWFTENFSGKIGRITPAGLVTEFSQGIGGAPFRIAAGADGNLWFTENTGGKIGRITVAGVVTEFSLGITANSQPSDIAAGPDGNLWFTEIANGGRIGRITPAGVVTEFSQGITANSQPSGIAAAPDGNLWFTENVSNKVGRITPAGVVTEFSQGITAVSGPFGIVAGPDGNLWFTELNVGQIGRITPAGVVTEFFQGIAANSHPSSIAAGPDGAVWFTLLPSAIGRFPSGAKLPQSISFTSTAPAGATVGGATYTPVATATSGLTVTLTIDAGSSSICTISGGVVSFIGVGTCVIDANQAGNATYNPAPQVQQMVAVVLPSRTWVSRLGVDSGFCARPAPCATFQFAHNKTNPSGAIDCVDSGDFGTLTITKSITIKCASVLASIAAGSGAGITISAGAADKIVLDGLDIEGLSAGAIGISVGSSGKVHVLNTTIRNFTQSGIALNASNTHVFIDNSFLLGNATGVLVNGSNNIASLTSSSVRASPTASLNAATASAIIGAQNSVINDSPVGIARVAGAQVISVGPSNLVTGAGSFTLTLPFE
jgi:streptogramin lyase